MVPEIIRSVRLRVPQSGHVDARSCVGDMDRAAEKPGTSAKDPKLTQCVAVTVASADYSRVIPAVAGVARFAI